MSSTHHVRRVLARICSAETMARVVDPTLADMRVESGRSEWRGYLAPVRALGLYAVTSAPGAMADVWTGDQRALPRGLAACAAATVVFAAPLIAVPAKSALRISPYAVALLVPQSLGLALPMSVLCAIPLAFRKLSNRRRLLIQGTVVSMLCAAANLVVMIQMIPGANQAFREEVHRQIHPAHGDVALTPGPMEMTLHELREQIEAAQATRERLTPEGMATIRRFEYTYHVKLALSAVPVPLGLLAVAITIAARGRARSIAVGIGSALVYVYGIFAVDSWTVQLLKRSDAVSPVVLAWAPTLLIAALATVVLWKSRFSMTTPCV